MNSFEYFKLYLDHVSYERSVAILVLAPTRNRKYSCQLIRIAAKRLRKERVGNVAAMDSRRRVPTQVAILLGT